MPKRTLLVFLSVVVLLPHAVAAFAVGDRVQATSNVNVRSSASATAPILGTVPAGALGSVVSGPTVNTYTWWNIKWDQGLSGWSAQNYVQQSTLVSTSMAVPIPSSASLLPFDDGHDNITADRINIVLVGINFATLDEFKSAASAELGWNGVPTNGGVGFGPFVIEPLRSSKDKFNIWYDPAIIIAGTNFATAVDEITAQIEAKKTAINNLGLPYVVPVFLNKLRSDVNTFIVPHADGYGIHMENTSFSALSKSELRPTAVTVTLNGNPGEPNQLTHELGHAIFGLADEKTDSPYDTPGSPPRVWPPNCVATKADAQALWGSMIGQVDPFYSEWRQTLEESGQWDDIFPPDVTWWKSMDEGMKVGYYYGKCYGDTSGINVVRPTDFSIMNSSQVAVFGPVNRKQVETVLGFFSGLASSPARIAFFSVYKGALGIDPVPQGTPATVQFQATDAKQCDMLIANDPTKSAVDQFNSNAYTTYATNIGSGGAFGSAASYYNVIPQAADTMLMLHCVGYDDSSALGTVHIGMKEVVAIPLPPTNLKYTCAGDSKSATMSWTASTGATSYNIRLDDLSNNKSTCTDGWLCDNSNDKYANSITTTSWTQPIAPNITYDWWVHAANTAGASSPTHASLICKLSAVPTATLSANPTSVVAGKSSTLSWKSTNATSCTGSGFTAASTTGSIAVTPATTTTYKIYCTGLGGTSNPAQVTVSVTPATPALSPDNSTITPTSGGSLITKDGTWSFSTATTTSGNIILRNGAQRGSGDLVLVYQSGSTFAHNKQNYWFKWDSVALKWAVYPGDPRTGVMATPQKQIASVWEALQLAFERTFGW